MSSSASSETMLHEMYNQQLLAIQQAVAEERTEDARINQLCQSASRAQYDHFVESLIQKSKIEGDLYMERALNHLESDVQHETNKLIELYSTYLKSTCDLASYTSLRNIW
jgi:hypothetical protein